MNDQILSNAASRTRPYLSAAITLSLVALHGTAFARHEPDAERDEIIMPRGGTATVLSSGEISVLANDSSPIGRPLTAILEDDVNHGSLILFPDGTFIYTHDGGNDKDDKFKYVAFDGENESRDTEVKIKFTEAEPGPAPEPVPPLILGQAELSVPEDGSLLIALQDLVVEDPDSRFPQDFTLTVLAGENYSLDGSALTPAPDFHGQLSVPVTVNDGLADSPIFPLVVTVTPTNDPPFVVSAVPDQVATEGFYFELPLAQHFSDIDDAVLTYAISGLPPSGSLTLNPLTGTLTGTPQLSDSIDLSYQIVVSASDAEGATAVLAFLLLIEGLNRPDLTVNIKVEPELVTFRDSPRWEIEVKNLGPGLLGEGMLKASWFSSEAPLALSNTEGCVIERNETTEPIIECALSNLPENSVTTISLQSTHSAPGDSNIRAVVTADDPYLENNTAGLSINLPAGFSAGPGQFLPTSAADIAASDVNLDGYLDLIVVGNATVVFLNDGQRALQTPGTNLGAPGGGVAVAVLDWNQDGAPDIAVASGNSFPDTLYLNDGLGGFTRAIELPSSQSRRIISTDLDSDGLAELVVSGALGTHIVRNNGQGGAEQVQIHESVGLDLTTGDIDGDGFPDLVIVEAGNRFVHVLVNAGDAFTASAFDYGSVAGVNLSDVDGDGAPDLLLAIDGTNLSVPQNLVLRNLVNGQFEDWALVGAAPTLKFLAGDVDRNGIADLVAINQTGVHQIFLGDGLGGYTLAEEHILSLGIRKGILIDINGDGSLDLLLAGEDANRVDIHANDGLGKFGRGDVTPPVMTLLGAPTVVIDSGDTFVDPGAAATDNIDGDITANVEVQGSVDSTLLGSYTLTYFVSDIAGNTAAVSRIVTVAARAEGGGGGGSFGWVSLLALCALAAARRRTRPRGS